MTAGGTAVSFLLTLHHPAMASPMASPTDTAPPPPPYQMSQAEFDQKTSHAIQLASSSANRVDDYGWQIYDPAAIEAIEERIDHQPPSSSSAGIPSTDTHRQVRQGRRSCRKVLPLTRHTKVRFSYVPFSGLVF